MYITYIGIYKPDETLQMIYFPCDLLAMCNPELSDLFDDPKYVEGEERAPVTEAD